MQSLSQIRQMLTDRGLHPRKRFGQNFLHDHNKLRSILAAASIEAGDRVLEVGPGTGTLTEGMLDAGANVVAVEIDRDLAALLVDYFADRMDRLVLLNCDVLAGKHALNDAIAVHLPPEQPFKLVANLPYNIASPLLVNLAGQWPGLTGGVVMVQREVAERLAAGPGGKTYGPLGILVQLVFEVQLVEHLSAGCFWPAPKVASSVVALTRREAPLSRDLDRVGALVHRLFAQRRKQIGSVLGRDQSWPAGIDPSSRPEQLSVEQLVGLAKVIDRV